MIEKRRVCCFCLPVPGRWLSGSVFSPMEEAEPGIVDWLLSWRVVALDSFHKPQSLGLLVDLLEASRQRVQISFERQ